MPNGFLKPTDHYLPLVIRPHPTLRQYCQVVDGTEADPTFHIYPYERRRYELRDEVELRNAKSDEDRAFKGQIS